MLTKIEAEDLAKKRFVDLDYGPIESHRVAVAEQESRWVFYFDGVGDLALPGHHVTVYVDKKTGACTVARGE